ncbi:MAG: class I SAM-dependent DNA methyltransferase [Solirubrobacterales bacterium]
MPKESAKTAYDRLAPIYDEYTAQNDYEIWVGEALLPELEQYGLQTGWALDVGCGTGRAFPPLLERGWQVVGCDLSPRMLAEAKRKYGSCVQLFEADGRELPVVSPGPGLPTKEAFNLVIMINDTAAYMTGDGDLERSFGGIRPNLNCDHGLFLFDTNTLATYREAFTLGIVQQTARGREWFGLTEEAKPGIVYEARLSGRDVETHLHRQRHWPVEQIREALEASGLRCVAALGQREEAERIVLTDTPDEERDHKVIYIARAS